MNSKTIAFYQDLLDAAKRSGVPFLVGGGFALDYYTSVERHIKDLDIFVTPDACSRLLPFLDAAGYRTEFSFRHWLAKARRDDEYVDVIFSSGNGLARVSDAWFERATPAVVLEVPVKLCAPEEMIWSKAFVMERDRYDGADVAHLLRARGTSLDWPRLLDYFGPHWRVLLSHLILFEFIYPGEPSPVPPEVLRDLMDRWERSTGQPRSETRVCQGTLLSATQYLADTEEWGYEDARLIPRGTMTRQEITEWSDAVAQQTRH
jgi:hypothetical protein